MVFLCRDGNGMMLRVLFAQTKNESVDSLGWVVFFKRWILLGFAWVE